MLTEIVEYIRDYAEDNDLRVTDYSGRAMFGATCLAVITDNARSTLTDICAGLADEEIAEIDEIRRIVADGARTDTFGFSQILYWPAIAA